MTVAHVGYFYYPGGITCICRRIMQGNTVSEKNDLYEFEGAELRNDNTGRTRGTLTRVRAAHDYCEFEVPGGKTVRRDVKEVLEALDNGYEFVSA